MHAIVQKRLYLAATVLRTPIVLLFLSPIIQLRAGWPKLTEAHVHRADDTTADKNC